jgi:hypothetical protein
MLLGFSREQRRGRQYTVKLQGTASRLDIFIPYSSEV